MSDQIAISIENVSKMYKLFTSKRDKIFDLFNLRFALRKNSCRQVWALRDINLEIPKGGKIGIIGRNGAGKSTLLKIVCGTIGPTIGRVHTVGRVSALLELGTGFHPEFSGRENAYASLAYMGVTGREAIRKVDDIIEFSELEEFIDNPIKTYSSGMYARLAFSVATCRDPEVLIIDEVLGAGDAYFAMKCVDRMISLTSGGTTVLFVSHDLTSVLRLCDRAIWIDRGRVIMEGDTLSLTKAYAASVREQEELSLKAKNLGLNRQTVRQLGEDGTSSLLFHVINDAWQTFRGRHPLRKISLSMAGKRIAEIKVGDAMDNDMTHPAHIVTAPGYIEWTEPSRLDGGYARVIQDTGGSYKHAAFLLPAPQWSSSQSRTLLEIEYKDISDEPVFVEIYDGQRYNRIGGFEHAADGQWKTYVADIPVKPATDESMAPRVEDSTQSAGEEVTCADTGPQPSGKPVSPSCNVAGDVYGSGEITITGVEFLDANGVERCVFISGETMTVRIAYGAKVPVAHPVFAISIYRMDGVVVHQAISSHCGIDFGVLEGRGFVEISYAPLLIGQGDYVISVAIFHYVDLLSPKESPAYCLLDRKSRIKIELSEVSKLDLGVVNHPTVWNRRIAGTADRQKVRT